MSRLGFVKYYAPAGTRTDAVGRMLASLVLFGGLLYARAAVSDIPKDSNYVIKHNVSCSAAGSFFQRESGPNSLGPDICYLCFCHNNDTAVCWRRENRKCDLDHYQDFGIRNFRTRRSPLSLGEVFFRDAARDFFNKQSPEQCKPFESSFSDGCPPADWCIGCTVCDCDANGRWDCHILSFCTDKHGKKQMKKRRGYSRNRVSKRQSKTSTTNTSRSTTSTAKPPKKPTRKRSVNPIVKRNQVKQSSVINKHKVNQVKTTKVNKFTPVKKPLPTLQSNKAIVIRNKVTNRPFYMKRKLSTNKPLNIKSTSAKSVKNSTVEVAQKVVKQFMTTMQKMIKNIDSKTNKTTTPVNKVLEKRSMSKHDKKGITKAALKTKFVTKPELNVNGKDLDNRKTRKSYNTNIGKNGRIKREVVLVQGSHKSNSNDSYKRNAINKTEENVRSNRKQNTQINNFTNIVLNIPNISNNETAKFSQLKNTINQDIYLTDNHIHMDKLHNISKNGTIYNGVNNTNLTRLWTMDDYNFQERTSSDTVKDAILLSTDRFYLTSNFTQVDDITNNIIDLEDNKKQYKKDKKYFNVSTQTENHSCKFRTLLQKLIGIDINQYNSTLKTIEGSKKPKRYTILTKIKKLFKKIFKKRNKNKFFHKEDLYYNEFNIKPSNYNKFVNCKRDSEERKKLHQMMRELKNESEHILKTIGIIKGLLHILEINTNKTQYVLYGSNENIKNLNKIVKNFYTGENSKKLTEDQRTQINYIQNNVQEFIISIGKFAKILDELIQIAICYNKRENKIDSIKINKSNNVIYNTVKDYSNTTYTKVEKLKKLILNYNVLQNKFIHQIYVILNNLDAKNTDNNVLKSIEHGKQHIQHNKIDAIETNSANIIKNIRKLKLLAEKINAQRINAQKRLKRETIDDDDPLEYLLILMEYLLKRHEPVYASANDGLDLLIEAIKSAPDIKLIKKKVLDNITEKTRVTRTPTPINLFKKYRNSSTSTTIREQKKYLIQKNKIKVADQSEDDDEEDEDKIEEIYRAFKSQKDFSSEQKDNSVFTGNNISVTSEPFYNGQEKNTSQMSRSGDKGLLRHTGIQDSLEEEITTVAYRTISVDLEITSPSPVTNHVTNANLENEVISNSNTNNLLVDSKANIDWIEENFKEIKQSREVDTKSSTSRSLTATRTHKYTDNISDVTNENKTYNEKKFYKTSGEEIMSKKQLDLLNSLDYVEDELDSKDDKFSSDTFV